MQKLSLETTFPCFMLLPVLLGHREWLSLWEFFHFCQGTFVSRINCVMTYTVISHPDSLLVLIGVKNFRRALHSVRVFVVSVFPYFCFMYPVVTRPHQVTYWTFIKFCVKVGDFISHRTVVLLHLLYDTVSDSH